MKEIKDFYLTLFPPCVKDPQQLVRTCSWENKRYILGSSTIDRQAASCRLSGSDLARFNMDGSSLMSIRFIRCFHVNWWIHGGCTGCSHPDVIAIKCVNIETFTEGGNFVRKHLGNPLLSTGRSDTLISYGTNEVRRGRLRLSAAMTTKLSTQWYSKVIWYLWSCSEVLISYKSLSLPFDISVYVVFVILISRLLRLRMREF